MTTQQPQDDPTRTHAWGTLASLAAGLAGTTIRDLVDADGGRSTARLARGGGYPLRLLAAARDQGCGPGPAGTGRRARGRGTARRDARGRPHQRDRGPRRPAHGTAPALRRDARGRRRRRRCRRSTRCSTGWVRSPTGCAAVSGWCDWGAHRAPSSTSASAARTSVRPWRTSPSRHFTPARHRLPLRLERRPDRHVRGPSRPRSGDDARHRRVEDLHDPRDDDQRPRGPRRGWWPGARRRRRRPSLRRGLDQRREGRRVRHRPGEHVRVLGLGRRSLLDGLRPSG